MDQLALASLRPHASFPADWPNGHVVGRVGCWQSAGRWAGAGSLPNSIVGWPLNGRQMDFPSLRIYASYELDNLPMAAARRPKYTPAEGVRFSDSFAMQIDLYVRQGCHLCDDADQLLRSYGLTPNLVDVDARPDLLTKFNQCVPVVVVDGKVRFRGKIDRMLLERLIAGRSS